ncbi:UdgX family uracil-DNA binding protein [Caulobacter sp. LARHSG274]
MAAPSPKVPERPVKAGRERVGEVPPDQAVPPDLETLAASLQVCRRCDLWRDATQGVAGEGSSRAALMIVGEQPGDREDRQGRPFVGPAGLLLDRAMAEAGVGRDRTFVTNAVKHFKHEPRGKRRLHKTPDRGEVQACRWWLDAERRLVKPRVILALGATAVLAVFGKAAPIGKTRGQRQALAGEAVGLVSWHPSFMLRMPDPDAKARAYAELVDDLRLAWKLAA